MASNGILPATQFAKALEAAGVVSDLNSIERIVIDVNPAEPVTVYVKRVAGPELKQVAGLLGAMMADGRAETAEPAQAHAPKCAAGCDLMFGHQAPNECQPASERPVGM
ncbi:MAG: hypothetical protein ACRDVE_02525 [Actinocrinis sp.]